MATMELRLFPLGHAVLFPGMTLPLQVFEPRYRQLVAECLEAGEPFGIVLIREGPEVGGGAVPHDVGTTARMTSVVPGPDGRLHLAVVGERRFRIVRTHHDRPYLWAEVEFLAGEDGAIDAEVLDEVRAGLRQFLRLGSVAAGGYEREPVLPDAPGALADRAIAVLTGIDAAAQQALLEQSDAPSRLQAVRPLLQDAIVTQHRIAATIVAARWAGFGAAN